MVVGNAFLYQQHLCVCKKRQSLFSIIRYDNTQLWSQTRHDFAKSYCGYCWWNVWKTIPTNKNTSMEGTCMLWIIGGGARGPSPPPHFWPNLAAKDRGTLIEQSLTLIFYSNWTAKSPLSLSWCFFWSSELKLAPSLIGLLYRLCSGLSTSDSKYCHEAVTPTQ